MTNGVVLSVITPVRDGHRFMAACIEAVARQQPAAFEHIVVDDGSSDRTFEIAERYTTSHDHLRLIHQEPRGQSAAMNAGLVAARGPVVSFVNVDDFYEPGALRRAIELFEGLPEPSVVVGNCRMLDEDDRTMAVNKPTVHAFEQLVLPHSERFFPINPTQYFYHRSLHDRIGQYAVDEHYMMDIDFWLSAMAERPHVVYVDEIFGNFRLIEGTKTTADIQAGTAHARFSNILDAHRARLPWSTRKRIAAKTFVRRTAGPLAAAGRRARRVISGAEDGGGSDTGQS